MDKEESNKQNLTKIKLLVTKQINTSRFRNVIKDITEINSIKIPACTNEKIIEQLNKYYAMEQSQLLAILNQLINLRESKRKLEAVVKAMESVNKYNNIKMFEEMIK